MTATTAPPTFAPWESSYPPALRNYQLDLAALPANAAQLATQAAADHGDQPAFTIVLPTGANVVRPTGHRSRESCAPRSRPWAVRL